MILLILFYCVIIVIVHLLQPDNPSRFDAIHDACQEVPSTADISFANVRQHGTTRDNHTHCTCAISSIFCLGLSRLVRTIPDNLRQPQNRGFSLEWQLVSFTCINLISSTI